MKIPWHKMDGQGHQRRILEQEWTTTCWRRLEEKKMEMDRAYIEKVPFKHHKGYAETKPAGQKKKRETLEHLEEGNGGGCRTYWMFLGINREDFSGQRPTQSVCW